MQVLAEAFVIVKKKGFVGAKGTAEGSPKLITLERRGGTLIEEIGSVEGVVPQKLESRSVQPIAARARHEQYLGAGMFAEFRAVRIALDVEFANGVDAQQHAAGSPRGHVVLGCACEFHAIEEKKILLRTVAGDGEVVGGGRVRNTGTA